MDSDADTLVDYPPIYVPSDDEPIYISSDEESDNDDDIQTIPNFQSTRNILNRKLAPRHSIIEKINQVSPGRWLIIGGGLKTVIAWKFYYNPDKSFKEGQFKMFTYLADNLFTTTTSYTYK